MAVDFEKAKGDIFKKAQLKIKKLKRKEKIRMKDSEDQNTPFKEYHWNSSDDVFFMNKKTHDILPPGLYQTAYNQTIGPHLRKKRNNIDELILVDDSVNLEIIKEIKQFWKIRDNFVKRGFIHKRGILLYGPPGSGKTSTINLLIELIVNQLNGIAVVTKNPTIAIDVLVDFRKVEPDRPLIVMLEDIDEIIDECGESTLLSLLDGENQINNVVFVATTNYPEKLKDRITNRPSRFDTIKYVGMPSPKARHHFLKNKEPDLTKKELKYWVKNTDGFSIAHLKELIILNKCYGKDLDESINMLKERGEVKLDGSCDNKTSVGFVFNKD